jgi:hypothetical protein
MRHRVVGLICEETVGEGKVVSLTAAVETPLEHRSR